MFPIYLTDILNSFPRLDVSNFEMFETQQQNQNNNQIPYGITPIFAWITNLYPWTECKKVKRMENVYKQKCKTEEYESSYFDQLVNELKSFQSEQNPAEPLTAKILTKAGPVPAESLNRILNPPLNGIKDAFFLHRMREISVPNSAMSLRSVRVAVSPTYRKLQESRAKRGVLLQTNPAEVEELTSVTSSNETVFTVKIYEPFKYICGSRRVPKVAQEIELLGSQSLTVLRDNIKCRIGPFLDISENPDQEDDIDFVDSGFMFINDTFYNDTRNPACLDYSQVLLEWMERKGWDGYPSPLKTAIMEDAAIKDLKFKLGFPYVFQHYGNCEHLIVFTDVRLITRTEREKAVLFPMVKQLSEKGVYCFVCGLNEAIFAVVGSSDHIQDPSQLCHQCLVMYHYKDGQKIGEFKAYKFGK